VPAVAMPLWLLAVAPVVTLFANVVALAPARRAAAMPAAAALRAD